MSVSHFDFVESAKRSLELPAEIDWRNAASRAYYAAFHLVRDASSKSSANAHFAPTGGTHSQLIDRFESYQHTDSRLMNRAKSIGYILRDMKTKRELADYEILKGFTKSMAAIQCQQFVGLADRIRDWLRDVDAAVQSISQPTPPAK